MTELDMVRTNHLIDPHLHIWGWEIPVYLFLGGITAGTMILSALLLGRHKPEERSAWMRWLPFAAPAVISLGMLALFLDLEHKLYVWRFYMAFRWTSPMSWGSWILLAIYPATLLLGLLSLNSSDLEKIKAIPLVQRVRLDGLIQWGRDTAVTYESAVCKANIGLGIALGAYTGILLGTLGARAVWSSAVLGPLFLTSGLSAAAAFLMLFPVNDSEHRLLRRWDMMAIVAEIILIFFYLAFLTSIGGKSGFEAAELFLGGRYTVIFWSLVVVAGLLVPLALEWAEERKVLHIALMAPVLVLVGGLSLRWILVAAGQA